MIRLFLEEYLDEMATICKDYQNDVCIAVNPDSNRQGNSYFKFYNSANYKSATKVVRILFNSANYIEHQNADGKKLWKLSHKDKKVLKELLNSSSKKYSNMTMGTVKVNGTVAPMIELGAGFDPELTARENIFLNGAILGYPQEMLKERFDEIIDFAELKDFVDVPVKNFSSGMTTRLGFSIATIYTPDILIVDEILAVGDFAFQKKCEKRIGDMLNSGTTLLLVSHSTEQVRRICDRAVLINKVKKTEMHLLESLMVFHMQVGEQTLYIERLKICAMKDY